jgi:hypothetical protein
MLVQGYGAQANGSKATGRSSQTAKYWKKSS